VSGPLAPTSWCLYLVIVTGGLGVLSTLIKQLANEPFPQVPALQSTPNNRSSHHPENLRPFCACVLQLMTLLTRITTPQSGLFISYLTQITFIGCMVSLLRVRQVNVPRCSLNPLNLARICTDPSAFVVLWLGGAAAAVPSEPQARRDQGLTCLHHQPH
jgi:hypothetical protein